MLSARAALPLRAFTLLVPTEDLDAPPPTVELLGSDSGGATGLRLGSGETVVYRDHDVVLGRAGDA
jgi:hypothetical protein